MNSRRRVTAALIGLLALVIGAWFGQHALPHAGGLVFPNREATTVR